MATILIVDDDQETRVLLNAILTGVGHEVVFSVDGKAGVEGYDRFRPDLVITDLVMPGLHGVLLIEYIRTIYPNARIIAVSGRAPEQLDRAVDAGAFAALPKPIDRDGLVATVDEALEVDDPWKYWVR